MDEIHIEDKLWHKWRANSKELISSHESELL